MSEVLCYSYFLVSKVLERRRGYSSYSFPNSVCMDSCPSGSRGKLIRSAINVQILFLVVTHSGLEVNTSVLKEQAAIFRTNLHL
jgi:hypothetical protein